MKRFCLALLAGVVLVLPVAAPAAAAPLPAVERIPSGQTYCPDGYVCLFRDYDYQGGGWAFSAGEEIGFLGDIGFNDTMSSWANDSGITYCWYFDADYRGEVHDMRDGYRVNVLSRENDQASSLRPC